MSSTTLAVSKQTVTGGTLTEAEYAALMTEFKASLPAKKRLLGNKRNGAVLCAAPSGAPLQHARPTRRGTWSHFAFFCVHEKMRARRWQWLEKVQALRLKVEPGVGKAACGHLEQAMGEYAVVRFGVAAGLLEDLIARRAEEEIIDDFDFPSDLGWERSVHELVGGLI
eukprot:4402870-Prymnesium_polylepis.1